MVEHLLCKQRVIGSNPIGSTRTSPTTTDRAIALIVISTHDTRIAVRIADWQVFDIVNGGLTRPETSASFDAYYNSLRVGFE